MRGKKVFLKLAAVILAFLFLINQSVFALNVSTLRPVALNNFTISAQTQEDVASRAQLRGLTNEQLEEEIISIRTFSNAELSELDPADQKTVEAFARQVKYMGLIIKELVERGLLKSRYAGLFQKFMLFQLVLEQVRIMHSIVLLAKKEIIFH